MYCNQHGHMYLFHQAKRPSLLLFCSECALPAKPAAIEWNRAGSNAQLLRLIYAVYNVCPTFEDMLLAFED